MPSCFRDLVLKGSRKLKFKVWFFINMPELLGSDSLTVIWGKILYQSSNAWSSNSILCIIYIYVSSRICVNCCLGISNEHIEKLRQQLDFQAFWNHKEPQFIKHSFHQITFICHAKSRLTSCDRNVLLYLLLWMGMVITLFE